MDKLNYVKERLIKNLNNNLIPFWDKMFDEKNGGFYGQWNDKPIENSDKGTVYLARLLWSFSKLYEVTNDPKYLIYTDSIFNFLNTKLYDHINKGFYWSSTYNGKVKNDHKHLYAQSFCLYGLSEYFLISKNKECLNIINELYNVIDRNFVDFPNNYVEERSKNSEKCQNKLLEGYEIYPEITTNTLLHLIESTGNCYKALKDEKFKTLCLNIVKILFDYGYDYSRNSLIQFLDYNLKPIVDVVSYGHDIEVSWLLNDILDSLDCLEFDISKYQRILFELGNSALDGIQNNYLLADKINGEVINKDIIWWVQAEALIALLKLYKDTGNVKYVDQLYDIYKVLEKSIITENEWLWSANEYFEPQKYHNQAETWKANYHNIRCILKFMEV